MQSISGVMQGQKMDYNQKVLNMLGKKRWLNETLQYFLYHSFEGLLWFFESKKPFIIHEKAALRSVRICSLAQHISWMCCWSVWTHAAPVSIQRVSACHRLLLALQFGRFFFNLLIDTDSTNRSEFHRGCHSVAIFFKRIWLKKVRGISPWNFLLYFRQIQVGKVGEFQVFVLRIPDPLQNAGMACEHMRVPNVAETLRRILSRSQDVWRDLSAVGVELTG